MAHYAVAMELTGTLHLHIEAESVDEAEAKAMQVAYAGLCQTCSKGKEIEVGGIVETLLLEDGAQ